MFGGIVRNILPSVLAKVPLRVDLVTRAVHVEVEIVLVVITWPLLVWLLLVVGTCYVVWILLVITTWDVVIGRLSVIATWLCLSVVATRLNVVVSSWLCVVCTWYVPLGWVLLLAIVTY